MDAIVPVPGATANIRGMQPLTAVTKLLHTVLDGTVESFVNVYDNLSERLLKRDESFPHSLHGKVAIVTGGNAGIGFATAKQLARRGAHVVLACRDKARAEAAVQAISAAPPLPGCLPGPASALHVEAAELDLGRLSSVRRFAEQWAARGLPLHLLVCNAGVMGPPQRLETADGNEMQFQVNFLSHWLLANQLLSVERSRRLRAVSSASAPTGGAVVVASGPHTEVGSMCSSKANALRPLGLDVACSCTAPSSVAGSAVTGPDPAANGTRVVMVTSLTHRAGPLQWLDKQSRQSYEPFLSYGLSKLANIITAVELQRRFDRSPQYGKDTAVAVHPGLVSTDLANGFFTAHSTSWAVNTPLKPLVETAVHGFSQVVGPLLMRSPDQSASVMLHACLAPSCAVAGRYLALGRPAQPDQAAEDPAKASELWDLAVQLTCCNPHPSLARSESH